MYVFFFFKQKTAYEMRISDWNSDVCSSDLPVSAGPICASRRNSSVVSVRSTAWRRLTHPFSTPIGYAVSAKPIAAMDANGRDGKRSGVIPLTSLVVSQKNWKVRFAMYLKRGRSAGRCPDTSCCTGSDGGQPGWGAAGA